MKKCPHLRWSSFSDQIDTFKTIKDVISSDPHFPISYNTGYQQYEGDGAAYADDDYFYVGNGIDIEIQQDINKPLIKYHADWGEGPEYEFDSYLYNVPKSSDYTVYFQVQSEVLYQIKMVGIGQFEGNYPRQASHSLSESFPEVSPTCTEKGSHAYYKCSCGLYFEDENLTKRIGGEDKLNEWKIQELGHDFDNGEAVYEWQINDNNLLESKCVGKFYCSHTDHGCTEFESLTADARYVKDSDATNTSNEKGHFEAEFSNGKTARTESNSYEVKDTMLIEEVNNNNDGLSACAVIGIVIGVLVGFCLICYLVAFFIWKKGGDPFSVIYKSFEKLNSLLFERK